MLSSCCLLVSEDPREVTWMGGRMYPIVTIDPMSLSWLPRPTLHWGDSYEGEDSRAQDT